MVEATAWRFRTGSAWRDLPDRFGSWNTIYKNFRRWATDGVWEDLLTHVQKRASLQGEIDWVVSVDSWLFLPEVGVGESAADEQHA